MPRPIISVLLWSEWAEDHVENHIPAHWVDDVVHQKRYRMFPNVSGHSPERIRLIGRPADNCPFICIVLGPSDDPEAWYVVTAFNDLSNVEIERVKNVI